MKELAILITGEDGVGKDTVARMFRDEIAGSYIQSIKDTATDFYYILTGVDWNDLNCAEKRIHRPVFSNFCEGIKVTLGKSVFAEALVRGCFTASTLIVPDFRFLEEFDAIRECFDVVVINVSGRSTKSLIKDNVQELAYYDIDNRYSLEHTEKEVLAVIKDLRVSNKNL